MNGTFFSISLPDKWLFVCKAQLILELFILCRTTLLNSLFPTFALVKCLGFSIYNALSFASSDSFSSSFLI